MEDFPSGPLTGGAATLPGTSVPLPMWGLLSWTYWLGPVAGGVVADLLYRFVLEGPDEASGGLIRGESAGFQEHQNRVEIQPHAAVHSVETSWEWH